MKHICLYCAIFLLLSGGVNAQETAAPPPPPAAAPAPEAAPALSADTGSVGSAPASRPVVAAGTSNVFDLNTQNAREKRLPTSTKGRGVATAFSQRYKLTALSRVKIEIFMGTKFIRRLVDEEQGKGQHYIYWDGLDETGAKLAGDFICRMTYKPAKSSEKTTDYNFQVK